MAHFGRMQVVNLKPGAEVTGDGSGLALRALGDGRKAWRWTYRPTPGGPRRVETIGYFTREGDPESMSLAAARNKVEQLKEALRDGRLQEVVVGGAGAPKTVEELANEFYLRRILPHRLRPEHVRGVLDKEIIPRIGSRKLQAFSTPACREVVKAVVDRGAPAYARQVLGALKQLGRWGVGAGYLLGNPAEVLEAEALGCTSEVGERWLTSEELPLWWRALDAAEMSVPLRNGLKLLLLTGSRSGALHNALWENVDTESEEPTWTIPVEDQKLSKKGMRGARAFVIPLSPLAVQLLEEIREEQKIRAGASKWVIRGWGKEDGPVEPKAFIHAQARLWARRHEGGRGNRKGMPRAGRRKELPPLLSIPPATVHDLRRTMRTHLEASLGVEWHVAERSINHKLGKMTTTYSKADYLPARRDAALRWADFVARLVAGEEAKIVPIGSAPARATGK